MHGPVRSCQYAPCTAAGAVRGGGGRCLYAVVIVLVFRMRSIYYVKRKAYVYSIMQDFNRHKTIVNTVLEFRLRNDV